MLEKNLSYKLIIVFIFIFTGLIVITIAKTPSIYNEEINLSVEYDSKILSSSDSGKIGHLGGTAVGDVNGDGVNDLLVSSYLENVTRYSMEYQPLDKDSWTESSNLSLWTAYNGIENISVSSYKVSGKKSIIGKRSSSKNGTFFINWNASLNLTGFQSLDMYINVSGRKENLTQITIYSENKRSLLYNTVNSLEKGNWIRIIINLTEFKKVGSYNLSNITGMALNFSGGYLNDTIKIDDMHFVINQTSSSEGAVYIFYGPIHGMYNTSDANVKIVGTKDSVDFGEYITLGNVNNDSYKDIIVGSPFTSDSAGKVQVFFGGSQLDGVIFKDNYSIFGKNQSKLGTNIISKDINNDFIDDLIFVAPNISTLTEIYVIYGSDELQGCINLNDSNPNITFLGMRKLDRLGRQRTFDVGDLRGDGKKDLVIGVQFSDGVVNTSENSGEIYIVNNISSKNGLILLNDGNITTKINGTDSGDLFGKQVVVGDLDSDGLDDILIGASDADGVDNNKTDSGEVYVIYGRPDLFDLKRLNSSITDVRIVGADSNDSLGNVIGAGNASAMFIGSQRGDCQYNNMENCGDAYIFYNIKNTYGVIDLFTYEPNIIVYGPEPKDFLRDLYIGDVSGDNIIDFIIGFREAKDLNGNKTGNIFVINGK